MIPTGRWAWWNQNGNVPLDECVSRAQQVEGVIVKALYWEEMQAFINAGIPVGVERYTYPDQPHQEAAYLAAGIARGAKYAVVNAEIEWERVGAAGGDAMRALLNELEQLAPGIEVYASVDTRGQRTHMPYQQVLGGRITGWMPMIYPKAFFPNPRRGTDWINQAFINSLETGQDFQGKPVLPTLQTYDNIGPLNVRRQIEDAERRGLHNIQTYTICHATNAEWAVWIAGQQQENKMINRDAKLFHTWDPAQLWVIDYIADVPIYRRWITTQVGSGKLIAELGEPENVGIDQLAHVPVID